MTMVEYQEKYFDGLDHGEARLKGIKAALDEALEKQDAESALELYDEFMSEDTMHGNMYSSIIMFPEYVAYFESHPELQEEYSHNLVWDYKWVLGNISDFYQISLTQIEKVFDQYIDFCKRFNYNLRSYYHKLESFIRSDIMGNGNGTFCGMTAEEAHKNMLRCKRDDMSDCKACETINEMNYIFDVEKDFDKAMKKAAPVINGKLSCAEEPHAAFTDIASEYFTRGDLENTDKFVRKAIHLINRDFGNEGTMLVSKSHCIRMMAYIDIKKAITLMKKCFPFIVNNPNGSEMFEFNRAAYHVMLCLEKNEVEKIRLKLPLRNEEIYKEDNLYTVTELKEFFYEKAKFYADKFDERNGNTMYNNRLAETYEFDYSKIKLPEEELDMPLLDYIRENIDEGELPDNFSLPNPEKDDDGDNFVDGAMDGILLYHSQPHYEELGELEDILKEAATENYSAAAKRTEKYFENSEKRAITIIDNAQNYIMENELDPNNIYSYGINLTVGSKNREAVKLGLCVLELFSDYNDALLKAITDLALSDEFTVYAIWAVKRLNNGNDIIFDIAQKVHGWGRIHAVDALEPETEEIKQWLLYEGIKNSIFCGYNAINCFKMADVHTLLENGLTQEQLTPVGAIIAYLVMDGPTIGIKAFEDGDDIINMYLDSAEELEREEIDDNILAIIGSKYDNDDIKERILSLGIEIGEEETEDDE